MKIAPALHAVTVLAALASGNPATGRPADDRARIERYIRGCEAAWARSNLADTSRVLRPCIAEDYIGVGSNGQLTSKKDVIAPPANPGSYAADTIDYINVRFFGDTAIAQGAESWVKRGGTRGRYVWNDIWLRRSGRWQIVASQDTPAPPLAPAK